MHDFDFHNAVFPAGLLTQASRCRHQRMGLHKGVVVVSVCAGGALLVNRHPVAQISKLLKLVINVPPHWIFHYQSPSLARCAAGPPGHKKSPTDP